jgi:hypothetical protein
MVLLLNLKRSFIFNYLLIISIEIKCETINNNNNNYNIVNHKNVTILNTNKSCFSNKTNDQLKLTYIHCYHNGICKNKLVSINEDTFENIGYCICEEVIIIY